MRNNVYSDIVWYGDMILPVWAKNQNLSKFHIQYIWKIVRAWHQLAHLNIHKDWSRNVSWKKCEISKCHNFLISYPIFIIFALFCREYFSLSFKFFKILVWISSLNECLQHYILHVPLRAHLISKKMMITFKKSQPSIKSVLLSADQV